ncbi:MAG: hypothetical protein ACI3ZD_00090 [Prevotella sp.]
MSIRLIFTKLLMSLACISILVGCKSKDEKFTEAEAACLSAVTDLLNQENSAFDAACQTYDDLILSHAKKVEASLPSSENLSTGIAKDTPLYQKDAWMENAKYFYLSLSQSGNVSGAARDLASHYKNGMDAAHVKLGQLYHNNTLDTKYQAMRDAWSDYSEDLNNGTDSGRADSIQALMARAGDIYSIFLHYQPDPAFRLGGYTCELADSIERVNKYFEDYKHLYNE